MPQQNVSVLYCGCWLTQIAVYNCHKTVGIFIVVVVVFFIFDLDCDQFALAELIFVFLCVLCYFIFMSYGYHPVPVQLITWRRVLSTVSCCVLVRWMLNASHSNTLHVQTLVIRLKP